MPKPLFNQKFSSEATLKVNLTFAEFGVQSRFE